MSEKKSYKDLYFLMFHATEDALNLLEANDAKAAADRLIQGQRDAEEIVMEQDMEE